MKYLEKRIIGWSIYHTHGEGIIKGNKHTRLCKGGTNSLKKITALWMYTIANSDYLLHCGTLMMYLRTTFTSKCLQFIYHVTFYVKSLQVSCAKSLGCSRDDRLGRVHCFDWHASVKNWGKLLKAEPMLNRRRVVCVSVCIYSKLTRFAVYIRTLYGTAVVYIMLQCSCLL